MKKGGKIQLILLGIIFLIMFLVICVQINRNRNPFCSKLLELGFVKEEYNNYSKGDLKVYLGSGAYANFSQKITDDLDTGEVPILIEQLTNYDISYINNFLNEIISSGSYKELNNLTFDTEDFLYGLSINKINDDYYLEQYIDLDYVYHSSFLKIDNFRIDINDNYDDIINQAKDLYKLNFDDKEKNSLIINYAFNKYFDSLKIAYLENDMSFVIDGHKINSYSNDKGTSISFYESSYVYDKRDIIVEYSSGIFEKYYKELFDIDFNLLKIEDDRDTIINYATEIIDNENIYNKEIDIGNYRVIIIRLVSSEKYIIKYEIKE